MVIVWKERKKTTSNPPLSPPQNLVHRCEHKISVFCELTNSTCDNNENIITIWKHAMLSIF